LKSIEDIVDEIIVIDSFSDDRTKEISMNFGCKFYQNKWKNYSNQFLFGQEKTKYKWVLRIDADEIIDEILKQSIIDLKNNSAKEIKGFYFNRYMFFEQKPILYGGLFPVKVVRLFNKNHGQIEQRWMDEHIIIDGKTSILKGKLIDNNLNNLEWWKEKHFGYANREAYDLLCIKYKRNKNFSTVASYNLKKSDAIKRLIKENIYNNLPINFRSKLYFFFRFYLMLGFLDSSSARKFHRLQGLWYRNLVDSKIIKFEEDFLSTNEEFEIVAKKHFRIDI